MNHFIWNMNFITHQTLFIKKFQFGYANRSSYHFVQKDELASNIFIILHSIFKFILL